MGGGRRGWRRPLAVLALALAALGLYRWLRPRAEDVAGARARRGPLTVFSLCEGKLEPPPGGALYSPEEATVAAVPARDGESVRRGAALVRLSAPDLVSAELAAREDLARLSARAAESAARLARARREEESRARRVSDDAALLRSGAITDEMARADRDALADARGELSAAEKGEAALVGPGSEVAAARQREEDLARRVAALLVRAPFDGVVYGLPARAGVSVRRGDLVASVADPEKPRVRVWIDEPDLPAVAAGEAVEVTFDGLPGRLWSGRITSPPAGVREVEGRRVGEASAQLADPERRLPFNASVNVKVILAHRDDVLLVPRAALLGGGRSRHVFLARGGRARLRAVTVGLLGIEDAEVTSGLAAGDRVLIPSGEALSDGQRVIVEDTQALPRR